MLDNTYLMDGPSWDLMEVLATELKNVAIILLSLIEMGQLVVKKDANEAYK